ncbi:MAG: efflux RND transporter permease subunit [Verrucomicrobia bacterium]|nr:efflux RND transporter permease subunit [Verrucomicrobiota bacterium]
MNLTAFSLKNTRFTFVVFACIAALGLSSFLDIPRREDPLLTLPGSVVVVVFPGASATEIERLVVRPIEDSIKELDDVRKMRAIVKDGVVILTVDFNWTVQPDKVYDDVLRQVNKTKGSLPPGIHSIEVRRLTTLNTSTMQFAIVSPDASNARLEDIAENMRRRFESVRGVRTTERHALPSRQVRVTLNADRGSALRVPPLQVIGAIEAGSASIPGGTAEIGDRRFNIETSGAYRSLDDIRRTPIAGSGTAVVRLGDIADVSWENESNEYFARFNGQRAVFVSVSAAGNVNLFDVRQRIAAELERIRPTLPADVKIESVFDQTNNIRSRLAQLEGDFLIAFALVLVTVFPLGFRASLLVLVSIPLSLAMGVFALQFMGHSLNQLSIVGFVIALGLLVDDSIVVVENIARFRRMGYEPIKAALAATNQIAVAVVGTTAAMLFAFFPLLRLPGGPGQFIFPMPLAVVATVLASMFVSLTIIPLLASRLLRADEPEHGNFVLRALDRAIHVSYRPFLHFCMRHRILTLLLAAALTAVAPLIVKKIGFSLFPKAGIPQFLVEIEAEEGASLTATDAITRKVEAILATTPEIDNYAANIGRGNPQVYYNWTGQRQKSNVAAVLVSLKKFDPKTSPGVIDNLRQQFTRLSGARIDVVEFENGPGTDAPVAVRLIGEDIEKMTAMAAQVTEVLKRHPGTEGIANPLVARRMDFKVVVNEEAAALLGVTRLNIDRTVRLAFAGLNVARFRDTNGEEFNLQLSLPRGERATLENWQKIAVPSATGAYVPIEQIAHLEFSSVPPIIERFNRERSSLIKSQVRAGYNVGKVTEAVAEELGQLQWPADVRWMLAGEVESKEESFGGMGKVLLIAAFGIFAILVLEFGSFRGTLIVASVVPLGIIGGVSALWLTGYSLSFTGAIGFIALIGMEIKNSILLVDFTNQLREQGVPLHDAIERAGETRFLPIVLTTATALGALLPLAMQGSGLYSPLAIVIIGGLISSLLLSRVVTPVMYSLLPPKIDVAPKAES